MSGEWGGLLLQLIFTIAVVLAAIAGLYWLIRRYSGGPLGRLSRGRVPRLAIVDATAVDARRQLVLVRRDNVEHLLLIGGPSDVVVEQAIQRRRRPTATQADEQTAMSEAAGPAPTNPPIPFPQVRPQATPATTSTAPRRSSAPSPQPVRSPDHDIAAEMASVLRFTPERPDETLRPEAPPEPTKAVFADIPAVSRTPAATATPFAPRPGPETASLADLGLGTAIGASATLAALRQTEPESFPAEEPDDTATQVSDLEREMARLLGEITAKRS